MPSIVSVDAYNPGSDFFKNSRPYSPEGGGNLVYGRVGKPQGHLGVQGVSKSLMTILLVLLSSLCLPSFAQSKEKHLTESQQVLNKVMEDIRYCDKTTPYGYDSRTKTISPPELKKIKGLKLKKLYREIAVFEINERYEGLRARVLTVGREPQTYVLPIHSVSFGNSYKTVRERLEQRWEIELKDWVRPGPDVIDNGMYSELTMDFDGKPRTLSIENMPADVYPHIALPDVGCNHVGI
jgi:hypothetical protein